MNANPLTAFKQAKEVIQTANDKLKSSYDEVAAMDQTTAPTTPQSASGIKSAPPAPAVKAEPSPLLQVGEANSVKTASTPTQPPPGPAFVKWARKVHIGGIRAGSAFRVFIDRNTYQKGDMVDVNLGIRIADYNSETRVLQFIDRTGAVIEIKYGAD